MRINPFYEVFKKHQVMDVANIREFLNKYFKHEIYYKKYKDLPELTDGYAERVLRRYEADFNRNGFIFISEKISTIRKTVEFYG